MAVSRRDRGVDSCLLLHGTLRELRALLQLVLLPMVSLVLPWRICAALLWQVARLGFLYRTEVEQAQTQAKECLPLDEAWGQRARFNLLVDNCDYFLSLTRGAKWMQRNLHIVGSQHLFGAPANVLLVTFHWGQGFWALRYFRDRGYPAAWLHLPVAQQLRWGEYVSGFMGRRRIRQVERLAGAASVPVGGSIAAMRARLCDDKLPVMAMPDVAPRRGQACVAVRLLGRDAWLPAGVFRLAAAERIRILAYTICTDRNGTRRFCITSPLESADPALLAQQLADVLSDAVRVDSSAWYMWPFAGQFFTDPRSCSC